MAFWWVNHKQAYRQETDGGYIWSSKTNANGARNTSYDNLARCQNGDVIFSYAFGPISQIGRRLRFGQLAARGCISEQLWQQDVMSRLLSDGGISGRLAGLLALIQTPEAMESYVLRVQGKDDAKRCIDAVQEATALASRRGWLALGS
jgi:hypothetical protein